MFRKKIIAVLLVLSLAVVLVFMPGSYNAEENIDETQITQPTTTGGLEAFKQECVNYYSTFNGPDFTGININALRIGDEIKVYGTDALLTIKFDNGETKKFLLNTAVRNMTKVE